MGTTQPQSDLSENFGLPEPHLRGWNRSCSATLLEATLQTSRVRAHVDAQLCDSMPGDAGRCLGARKVGDCHSNTPQNRGSRLDPPSLACSNFVLVRVRFCRPMPF